MHCEMTAAMTDGAENNARERVRVDVEDAWTGREEEAAQVDIIHFSAIVNRRQNDVALLRVIAISLNRPPTRPYTAQSAHTNDRQVSGGFMGIGVGHDPLLARLPPKI